LPLLVPLRMVSGLFNAAVAGVGRAGTALRNTVITVVVWRRWDRGSRTC